MGFSTKSRASSERGFFSFLFSIYSSFLVETSYTKGKREHRNPTSSALYLQYASGERLWGYMGRADFLLWLGAEEREGDSVARSY